ncbi:MAG: hypothetical protein H0T78_01715, partial [Longispora sp.]|nr:hypothetical protein [Longispora sp. (in: high G+C Gram-positive bacteria)]
EGVTQFETTSRLAGEKDPGSFTQLLYDIADQLLELAAKDAALAKQGTRGRQAEEFFDQIRDDEQAILIQDPRVRLWSYNRYARDLLSEHGHRTLYHFHLSQLPDEQAHHLEDVELYAAIAQARADYWRKLATSSSEDQAAILDALSPQVREDLLTVRRHSPEHRQKADEAAISEIYEHLAVIDAYGKAVYKHAGMCYERTLIYPLLIGALEAEILHIERYVKAVLASEASDDASVEDDGAYLRRVIEGVGHAHAHTLEIYNILDGPKVLIQSAARTMSTAKEEAENSASEINRIILDRGGDQAEAFLVLFITFAKFLDTTLAAIADVEKDYYAHNQLRNISGAFQLKLIGDIHQLVIAEDIEGAVSAARDRLDKSTRQQIFTAVATAQGGFEEETRLANAFSNEVNGQEIKAIQALIKFNDEVLELLSGI